MDKCHYLKPVLTLQSFFGFKVLNTKNKSKMLTFLYKFQKVFIIVSFLFVMKEDLNFLLGQSSQAVFIRSLNTFLGNLVAFSFFCTFQTWQKCSFNILKRFKLLDDICTQHFRLSVSHQKLRGLSFKLLSIPIFLTLYSFIKKIVALKNAFELLNVLMSQTCHFFFLLQLSFYINLLTNVYFRMKFLNTQINFCDKVKSKMLRDFLEISFSILNDIKSGFWLNILMILGKNFYSALNQKLIASFRLLVV